MLPASLRLFDFGAGAVSARGSSLLEQVPDLLSLKFTLREAWPGEWSGRKGCVRHVQLQRAPARFELPCLWGHCRNGTYDLTDRVLAALARYSARFVGEVRCSGFRGSVGCLRQVRFEAAATYRPRATPGWGHLSLCDAGAAVHPPGAGALSRGAGGHD